MTRRRYPGLPPTLGLAWLVQLRWLVVLGQLAAVAVASATVDRPLPLAALLAVVGIAAASNLLLPRLGRQLAPALLLPAAVGLDLVLLTALLALAGGPASHFSVLYLLPVALAAMVLGAGWGWVAVAASALCYASLFLLSSPIPHAHGDDHGLGAHIVGMWIATALVAGVIATVVGRIASALRAREVEVRALEERAARDARLVSLSTLAAGAAHELATPLATIAVAAHELERDELASPLESHRVEDARLIRAQVERCRAILLQMGESAGQAAGEASETIDARELLEHVRAALAPAERDRVEVVTPRDAPPVFAPRGSLARALTNLLRNGLDASERGELVRCQVEAVARGLRFVVSDHGAGMPADVLARAGEPFFSTKPPGSGQGLGLFLARAVAEQLGGALRLESRPGAGTIATLEIPLRNAAGVQAA